jgi:ABC-2 type transport system permease protein
VALSVLGVTPGVDPHRRVNPTDAGENSLVLQVAFWLLTVLVAPTAVMAALLAFVPGLPWWFGIATVVVAVANGGLVAWAGGALAVARLRARLPETFGRLRYPRTVLTTAGGDWLDRFARRAEATAVEAAAARAEK